MIDLSSEQLALRDAVRDLVKRYDRQYWLGCLAQQRYPDELWRSMADIGLMGLLIPEEYGGAGRGATEVVIVGEELHQAGVSMSSWQHLGTCLSAIIHHGTDEQRAEILPAAASGQIKISLCVTEPDAGTNTFRIRTRATEIDGGYRLNGHKLFIGGADIADYLLIVARDSGFEESADRRAGISLFLVDRRTAGISTERIDMVNPDLVGRFFVHLDDVTVPLSSMIGPPGEGLKALFKNLNVERVHNAAQSIGLGNFVLQKTVDYVRDRVVFSDPIGAYQGVQHPLARARMGLDAARLMTYHAASQYDAGQSAAAEAVMAKTLASEAACAAADLAVQFHGGSAFDRTSDVFNLYSQIRVNRIVPLNNEMALNFIGERVLGLPKSYRVESGLR